MRKITNYKEARQAITQYCKTGFQFSDQYTKTEWHTYPSKYSITTTLKSIEKLFKDIESQNLKRIGLIIDGEDNGAFYLEISDKFLGNNASIFFDTPDTDFPTGTSCIKTKRVPKKENRNGFITTIEPIQQDNLIDTYEWVVKTNEPYNYKEPKMHNRLEEITYHDVKEELKREDLDNSHIIEHLPQDEDVIRVLSDTATVNFYIQTKDSLYHLWIGHNGGVDMIDGKMTSWDEEDWDLITFGLTNKTQQPKK